MPLGLIVGLLKDGKGDINLSLPVGGKLNGGGLDFVKPKRTLADLLRALVEALQRRLAEVRPR